MKDFNHDEIQTTTVWPSTKTGTTTRLLILCFENTTKSKTAQIQQKKGTLS